MQYPVHHERARGRRFRVAILPVHLDINESMEDIITALGETERKLVGVVINELTPTAVNRQRDKQYA